jgi:hypothetical protein
MMHVADVRSNTARRPVQDFDGDAVRDRGMAAPRLLSPVRPNVAEKTWQLATARRGGAVCKKPSLGDRLLAAPHLADL